LSSDDRDQVKQRYPDRALINHTANSGEKLAQSKRTAIASEVAATLEHGLQQKLDTRVESIDLTRTVARSGPKCGTRCAIDAIYAMLVALVAVNSKSSPRVEARFRTVLQRLSGVEAQSLDHMQHHLEKDGGLGPTCDWKPLERVLALRPLFFRLIKSGGCQREVIGPKGAGQSAGQSGDARWLEWKMVAQSAVLALGDRERLCVLAYIKLCIERRGGTSWLDAELDSADQFPGLLDSKTGTSTSASRTENHLNRLHSQSQEEHFPPLGDAIAPVINATSEWARLRQERRSNRSGYAVLAVTHKASKLAGGGGKDFMEQRATQALANIADAKANKSRLKINFSKAVDSWEELVSEDILLIEEVQHTQMEASADNQGGRQRQGRERRVLLAFGR